MGKFINTNIQPNKVEEPSVQPTKMRPASKEMIESIKNKVGIPEYFESIIVPQLGDYYSVYPVDFEVKPVVCCPLHDENSPSFRYYEETNSFYCFGCKKGGNIITLHRQFAEKMGDRLPSYNEAANFLYDYFIKNKDTSTFQITPQVKKEKRNSDVDLVRYNIFKQESECQITYDKSLSMESKERLWDILDNIDILISKDLIDYSDARETIKNSIREEIKNGTASCELSGGKMEVY